MIAESLGVSPVVEKLIVTFLILFIGYALSRLLRKIYLRKLAPQKRISKRRFNLILILSIVAAIVYLTRDSYNYPAFTEFMSYVPQLILAFLIIILGIMLVNMMMGYAEKVVDRIGISRYFRELGYGEAVRIILTVLRLFLYVLALQISFTTFDLTVVGVRIALNVLMGLAVGSIVVVVIFALKTFVTNYTAGIYLKMHTQLREGMRVRFRDQPGRIEKINSVTTSILSDSKYVMMMPNSKLLEEGLEFKMTRKEIDVLEAVRKHYVAQTPSNCGPACTAIALSMLGHKTSQKKIADMAGTRIGKGTRPEFLGDVMYKITQKKILTKWINADQIYDLKEEISGWLSDGALLICDFKKSSLFPELPKAHYVLCVGMEGDDLIIIDPNAETGGSYLVDYRVMWEGMKTYSEFLKEKRGYLVIAPKDSVAYYRIEKKLYFSDIGVYERISKSLEEKLRGIIQKRKDTIFSPVVRRFLSGWEKKEKVTRMWRP